MKRNQGKSLDTTMDAPGGPESLDFMAAENIEHIEHDERKEHIDCKFVERPRSCTQQRQGSCIVFACRGMSMLCRKDELEVALTVLVLATALSWFVLPFSLSLLPVFIAMWFGLLTVANANYRWKNNTRLWIQQSINAFFALVSLSFAPSFFILVSDFLMHGKLTVTLDTVMKPVIQIIGFCVICIEIPALFLISATWMKTVIVCTGQTLLRRFVVALQYRWGLFYFSLLASLFLLSFAKAWLSGGLIRTGMLLCLYWRLIFAAAVCLRQGFCMALQQLRTLKHAMRDVWNRPEVFFPLVASAIYCAAGMVSSDHSCHAVISPEFQDLYFDWFTYLGKNFNEMPPSNHEWHHWLLAAATKTVILVGVSVAAANLDKRIGSDTQLLLFSGLAFGAAQLGQNVQIHPYTGSLVWHDDYSAPTQLFFKETGFDSKHDFRALSPFAARFAAHDIAGYFATVKQLRVPQSQDSAASCTSYRLINEPLQAHDWKYLWLGLTALGTLAVLRLLSQPRARLDPTAELAVSSLEIEPHLFRLLRCVLGLAGLMYLSRPCFVAIAPHQQLQREAQLFAASLVLHLFLFRTDVTPRQFSTCWAAWRLLMWVAWH